MQMKIIEEEGQCNNLQKSIMDIENTKNTSSLSDPCIPNAILLLQRTTVAGVMFK